ncbi:membrane protein suppressor for copper-sensitivity ScsB [Vibrio sinaloensis DSM 21326]|uniref:Membrane protein suppressor for copper-sensitivity ScsB n=1 Tax=Vibrio sinaloensis DSM 21326 TaxID=945550 RepID=E8M1D9_PHOS4|nr:protein-disulfide reductase DsbD domain-containing protein [Vibrio sinaloensis]EGA72119.1 membrane protein suppressor for copper-sensitivity ScsB [Vibrio sinaloensis DSM 21326]
MNTRHRTTFMSAVLSIVAFIYLLFAAPVYAAVDTGWLTNPQHPPVKTRFVLTGQTDPQRKLVEGFLEVDLSGDWKTYWRSPGEGGVAPSIDWQQSENLVQADWHWPYPQQFELLGIHTLGYKGDTLIPITLQVEDWSQPVNIDATLTLSSCTTICVLTDYPIQFTFTPSQLEVSESAVYQHAKAISLVPKESPLIVLTQAIWDQENKLLELTLENVQGWSKPEFIVDGKSAQSQEYSYKHQHTRVEGTTAYATFEVSSWLGDIDLVQQQLFVSIKDDNLLAQQTVPVSVGLVEASSNSLLTMVGFALLGGLILNIMPCVLPVLGMKLSGVLLAQGTERRQIRWQFLASSAGILASFWLIAGLLLGLKLTGNAIGWGIQFQTPWFIGFMVLVTVLFGANMLGLFSIRLSVNTNTWLASKGDNSYLGHFTQGMFATLLATPCSAPFLGTAVAFALATGNLEMFAIFTALAFGMATPWLLVATFPGLASLLPKPGAWMNRVKILFGLMMLVTSIWLLSLLSNHIPLFWVLLVAILVLVGLLKGTKRAYGDKAMAIAGAATLVLTAGSFLVASVTTEHWATPLPQDLAWKPLSNNLIEKSVSEGKVVFVNVTADWCVTCKANKIGVILQDPVYSALQSDNVVNVQGDWTHPDGAVTDYLRAHGRYGVPFNIVYGPHVPQGIPLPVILTEEVVLKALDIADGEA